MESFYFKVNNRAIESVWKQKKKGLNLSDRIWEKGEKSRKDVYKRQIFNSLSYYFLMENKMSKKNNKTIQIKESEYNKMLKDMSRTSSKWALALTMMVLRDKYGFGKKRMSEFITNRCV